MVEGIQEGEKTFEGDIGDQRKNIESPREDGKSKKTKPGRRQAEKPAEIVDADQIRITVEHFFCKKLNDWFGEVRDPRKKNQCTCSSQHLLWLATLMFVFRLGSRRQLSHESKTNAFLSNLLALSGGDEEFVAGTDTTPTATAPEFPFHGRSIHMWIRRQRACCQRCSNARTRSDPAMEQCV